MAVNIEGGIRTPGTVSIEGGQRTASSIDIEGGQRSSSGQVFLDGGVCAPSGPSDLEGRQRTVSSDVNADLNVAGVR